MRTCKRCKKVLTHADSIRLGIGSHCRIIIKNEQAQKRHNGIEADFDYKIDNDVIVIRDCCLGSCSVTNDINNVLSKINSEMTGDRAKNISYYKILYKDSTGIYDGIKHSNGLFISFFSINEILEYKAISKINK